MSFGLSQPEFDLIEQLVVKPLADAGYQVWCFGSRARGNHHRFSDLDLLVSGKGNPQALLGEIQEVLEESTFPYKVDIVFELGLAESYRDNVMRDRILFNYNQ